MDMIEIKYVRSSFGRFEVQLEIHLGNAVTSRKQLDSVIFLLRSIVIFNLKLQYISILFLLCIFLLLEIDQYGDIEVTLALRGGLWVYIHTNMLRC